MTPPPALCITHAAVATPLGHDLETTWKGLCEGQSGIRPVTRFDTSSFVTDLAACVPAVPASSEGRSLICSLLDILAAQTACWPLPAAGMKLFLASTKAGVDLLEDHVAGRRISLEQLHPDGMRQHLCRQLGLPLLKGENVSAACASGLVALIRGAQELQAGRCQSALIVAADLASSFTMSGFSALRALSTAPCRPFDAQRDGLTLGEGAAALLLQPLNAANDAGHKPLGLLSGWGLAADALHITAPARDGRGLVKAVQQTLCRAGKSQVDAVCAHGTGTVYNDAMELTALEQVLPAQLPLFSSKGALGHAMAASGAVEVALCLQALQHKLLPPTLGCVDPDPRAGGFCIQRCQEFAGRSLLSCNSGFGGVNAAVILEHPWEQEESWAFI